MKRSPTGPPTPSQMAWYGGMSGGSILTLMVLAYFPLTSFDWMGPAFGLIGLGLAASATYIMDRSFFLRLVALMLALFYLMLFLVPVSYP